ncbi:MAG TPA: hypothetical protein VKB95_17030 [Chitinophagaceae bacterium]|nr:hypothetical protein [Chitinophagaceae bacterium]
MKKILFAILSFAFVSAHGQTADDIIQKYAKAMGGLPAINAIKTMKMKGTVTTQGMDLPLTAQIINGKAVRNDVEVMGQSVINSYKDGKGWKINPFAGAPTATDMTPEELVDFKSQTMISNQLMDYKARGHKVELLGQEDVEGIKTYKIKLTNKDDNKVTTYFISVADNTLVKSISSRSMQGQEMDVETFFSDIKDFNGLKFPMTRIQKIQGEVFQEIKMSSIDFNVPIDEKVFDKQ